MAEYRFAIAELFKKEGLDTTYKIARRLGISDTQAGRLVSRSRKRLDLETVNQLAAEFGWKPSDIYAEVSEKEQSRRPPKPATSKRASKKR